MSASTTLRHLALGALSRTSAEVIGGTPPSPMASSVARGGRRSELAGRARTGGAWVPFDALASPWAATDPVPEMPENELRWLWGDR